MTFITVQEVRDRSGVPASLITNTQITSYISQVEKEMARWMNTKFVPTVKIEVRSGNSRRIMFTRKNPLLSVRELKVNSTQSITPQYVNSHEPSGKMELANGAETSTFLSGSQNTIIKYIYGFLDESETYTTLNTASTISTDVALEVADITDFAINDWVTIYGMDGNKEVAQINLAPVGTTIQVDKLVKTHEASSSIVKLEIPKFIRTYMMIEAAICCGMNALGATYTFNAGYQLGDLQVAKGVPYTHWRESLIYNYKEREMRKHRIKIRPSIMVD